MNGRPYEIGEHGKNVTHDSIPFRLFLCGYVGGLTLVFSGVALGLFLLLSPHFENEPPHRNRDQVRKENPKINVAENEKADNNPGTDLAVPEPWLERTHARHKVGGITEIDIRYEYSPEHLPQPGRELEKVIEQSRSLKKDADFDEYHFGLASCLALEKRYREAEMILNKIKNENRKNACLESCARAAIKNTDFTDAEKFADTITKEETRQLVFNTMIREMNHNELLNDNEIERISRKISFSGGKEEMIRILLNRGNLDLAYRLFEEDYKKIPVPETASSRNHGFAISQQEFFDEHLLPAFLEAGEFGKAKILSRELALSPSDNPDGVILKNNVRNYEARLCLIAVAQLEAGKNEDALKNVRELTEKFCIRKMFVPLVDHGLHLEAVSLAKSNNDFQTIIDHALETSPPKDAYEVYLATPESYRYRSREKVLDTLLREKLWHEAMEIASTVSDYNRIIDGQIACGILDDAISLAEDFPIIIDNPSPGRGRRADASIRCKMFETIVRHLHEEKQYEKSREVLWKFPISWNTFLNDDTDMKNDAATRNRIRRQLVSVHGLKDRMSSLLEQFYTLFQENVELSQVQPNRDEFQRMVDLVVPNPALYISLLKAGEKELAKQWVENYETIFVKTPITSDMIGMMVKNDLLDDALSLAQKNISQSLPIVEELLTMEKYDTAISVAKKIPVFRVSHSGPVAGTSDIRFDAFKQIIRALKNAGKHEQAREAIFEYPVSWEQLLKKDKVGLREIKETQQQHKIPIPIVRTVHRQTFEMLWDDAKNTGPDITDAEYRQLAKLGIDSFDFFKALFKHDKKLAFEWMDTYRSYYGNTNLLTGILNHLIDEGLNEDALFCAEKMNNYYPYIYRQVTAGNFEEAIRIAEKARIDTVDPGTGEKQYDAATRTRAFEGVFDAPKFFSNATAESFTRIFRYPISWEKALGKKNVTAQDIQKAVLENPKLADAVRYTHNRTWHIAEVLAGRSQQEIPVDALKKMVSLGTGDSRLFDALRKAGQHEMAREMAQRQNDWYGNDTFLKQLQ